VCVCVCVYVDPDVCVCTRVKRDKLLKFKRPTCFRVNVNDSAFTRDTRAEQLKYERASDRNTQQLAALHAPCRTYTYNTYLLYTYIHTYAHTYIHTIQLIQCTANIHAYCSVLFYTINTQPLAIHASSLPLPSGTRGQESSTLLFCHYVVKKWSLTARQMKQERGTHGTRARGVPERFGALPIPKEARHTSSRRSPPSEV